MLGPGVAWVGDEDGCREGEGRSGRVPFGTVGGCREGTEAVEFESAVFGAPTARDAQARIGGRDR